MSTIAHGSYRSQDDQMTRARGQVLDKYRWGAISRICGRVLAFPPTRSQTFTAPSVHTSVCLCVPHTLRPPLFAHAQYTPLRNAAPRRCEKAGIGLVKAFLQTAVNLYTPTALAINQEKR
ncbi:hypothetical protein J6590_003167 [Homalodisca vitripennis]|nr:hypothetical protein J6590_003167 [Homalodisca vitripennis]